MKKILIKTVIVCLVVLLLPFILTLLLSNHNHLNNSLEAMSFEIYYEVDGTEEKLDFEQYIIGVVAANMPVGYDMEALKAQAVIARTYTLYNLSMLSEETQNDERFNTSELGLSYIDLSQMEQFWGSEDYKAYFTKLENAVYATQYEVLVYDDALILPVFFDTGSGYTRTALEAWGIDIPYLVSVPSKQDVTSTNYLKITEYSISDLISLLEKYYTDLDISEDTFFKDVQVEERDSTDYVTTINLGSQTVSGEEFAKVLGLNSNHFYIEDYEGKVRILCNGVGHGVGLSQYGANAMAGEGYSYKDILNHYYTGAQLIKIDNAHE